MPNVHQRDHIIPYFVLPVLSTARTDLWITKGKKEDERKY